MTAPKIAVVDYGRGNLFSLARALEHLGIAHAVTDNPDDLDAAERVIFPGVGAFGDAMAGLRKRGLVEPIRRAVAAGKPLFGICVGCQLLLERGEEFGSHDGLGIFPGSVARLPARTEGDPEAVRIPNVGWRRLNHISDNPVLRTLSRDDYIYFVHSFAPRPADPAHIGATCRINGEDIAVAVARDNVLGVQFHPEKSGAAGLRLLERFATYSA